MVKAFMIDMNERIEQIAATLVKAGSTFRDDQKRAYERSIHSERNQRAKWVLGQILDNAKVAEKRLCPLCDDTGIPHVYLELGKNRSIDGLLIEEIREGIRLGLTRLPGRPMAIRGDDYARLDQSGGLSDNPADLAHAPILLRDNNNPDEIKLTILMLGGGPAIRGITHRVFHRHDINVLIDEITDRAQKAVAQLGCSPCTLAIGIGRSQFEATALMMDAMAHGNYDYQTEFEKTVTDKVNECNVGALGLGGDTSVIATFAKIGPQRASGVRIVALRPCCCFEPRRASLIL